MREHFRSGRCGTPPCRVVDDATGDTIGMIATARSHEYDLIEPPNFFTNDDGVSFYPVYRLLLLHAVGVSVDQTKQETDPGRIDALRHALRAWWASQTSLGVLHPHATRDGELVPSAICR